jgi:hypothetical protein
MPEDSQHGTDQGVTVRPRHQPSLPRAATTNLAIDHEESNRGWMKDHGLEAALG